MARKVAYEVQSDLSGAEIPAGERVIVRFEFDAEDVPNFTADLTRKEGDELVKHVHAREVKPRNRGKKADAKA